MRGKPQGQRRRHGVGGRAVADHPARSPARLSRRVLAEVEGEQGAHGERQEACEGPLRRRRQELGGARRREHPPPLAEGDCRQTPRALTTPRWQPLQESPRPGGGREHPNNPQKQLSGGPNPHHSMLTPWWLWGGGAERRLGQRGQHQPDSSTPYWEWGPPADLGVAEGELQQMSSPACCGGGNRFAAWPRMAAACLFL